MGAALLRHALAADGELAGKVEVISAGIAATTGQPAADNAIAALRKVGLDLTSHRSQPVSPGVLDSTDLILGMTRSHLDLLAACGDDLPEMLCFRADTPEGDSDVPDPVGGSFTEYEACRDSLVEVIPNLISLIKERVS